MKEINVAFISNKLKEEFEILKSGKFSDNQLYTFIDRAINDLKISPNCGIKVPKRIWPKEYVQNYKITNLWKYDLPNGWRLVYTIESDDIKIMSIILEWFDHKDYERRFNY
ncbi:MAG: hypothetical protein PHF86_05480 [Candidatus Nanoarchaeia archaeon]|nr:hypothetical protein [Candidatus Nanoarchaeia archaeon]